ncbi:MAG: hypothetical protein IKG99_05620 [Bacteroidaceae bacterium]|nr:hypothetical protein [Bacteroidaceae bacterium]
MTELQKKLVQQKCNSMNIDKLLQLVQTNEISLEELPDLSAERVAYIEENKNKVPNLQEQKEWAEIVPLLDNKDEALLSKLKNYILQWESTRPTDNHVDEALKLYHEVEEVVNKAMAEKEEADWQAVDPFSKLSLIGHLNKYPNTTHRDEIEENVWTCYNKENVADLNDYLTRFPNGKFATEARQMLNAIVEWDNTKNTGDIFLINNYLQNNPETPFRNQAELLITRLKQDEKNKMKTEPNNYEVERLKKLLTEHILTPQELIFDNVLPENVLQVLLDTDVKNDLPDINQAIHESTPECKEGYTDVFFFGVPSTGKTCVLMGLSRSDSLRINLAAGGGDYASALQQYTDVGITVPRTPGSFVTTLEATISSKASQNALHRINLVEMSGEEFAFSIANNPDHEFSFEDMGTGATELLKNDNRKVFFLIIDPTANVVRINREITDGFDEMTGKPLTRLERCVVNQPTIIQKMVNLLENEKNAEIMKKVDSIHIIMTKSDTLGDAVEREEKALQIFNTKYKSNILEPLLDLCKDYNINSHTGFRPKLYTFSLGTFYVGGLYEYEQADSNKLVIAIRNSTQSERKQTLWDKIKKIVN